MRRFIVLAFLLLAGGLLFFACDSPAAQTGQSGPTAPPSQADAEAVANTFLTAWVNNDYDTMFGLVSGRSAGIGSVAFAAPYKDVEQKLKLRDKSKSFEIHHDQTERQGNTVAVHYDMTFDSGPIGKITDADRTIRLILEPTGQWRVAWSTMDIFDGMAGGAKLNVVLTQSSRGTILDRNGQVIAKDDQPNYAVKLLTRGYPTKKNDECFKKLAEVFRLESPKLHAAYDGFTGKDFGFEMGTLSQDNYVKYKPQLDAVCLLQYIPQTTRTYYGGSFAPQIVGFIGGIPGDKAGNFPGYSPDALVGREGVEDYWEKQLAGQSGAQLIITAPDGTPIRTLSVRKPSPSQDVTLTIDRDLQVATEKAIASAYDYANWAQFSTGAAAVVLNANTGEILAMASYPTINPDCFLPKTYCDVQQTIALYNQQHAFSNRATQELYAAGSVFKIVSTAAATDSGTFKFSDVYVCRGVWDGSKLGDQIRFDWIHDDKYAKVPYHDAITLQQGLTASCDAYFWQVGYKLNDVDAGLLKKYANQMGLGVKTGIDPAVEGEATGLIPDPAWKLQNKGVPWGLGDNLNTVIGQGDVQVTAIQIARMMMGVANGGTLYHPFLVRTVGAPGQPPSYTSATAAPDNMNLKPAVIQGIQAGLCAVVSDDKIGTAHFVFYNWDASVSQVQVCGKTGTAQTGQPTPNGWFAAYAGRPGQKPDLAIAVMVEHSREGSETAGPIVRRIIESYYHLPIEPWPNYWTGAYDPMTNPGASDGGVRDIPSTKK